MGYWKPRNRTDRARCRDRELSADSCRGSVDPRASVNCVGGVEPVSQAPLERVLLRLSR